MVSEAVSVAAGLPHFGRYYTVALLGIGGMAEVYRAFTLDSAGEPFEVVVKRIRPQLCDSPTFVEMFEREARRACRLVHPNLVRVLDHGPTAAGYVQVMEYIDGVTLVQLVRARRRALPWAEVALIGREVARGLGYMHHSTDDEGRPTRVVHRDVSPDNIMVTADGRVKLLDFGIAKTLDGAKDHSLTGTLKGKLGYMAPEQLEGRRIDERLDQFALGVVLWEMVTGRRLYDVAKKLPQVVRERRDPVRPPSVLAPDVPAALELVIMRLLDPEPARRFADMAEVVRALERSLGATSAGAESLAALVAEVAGVELDDDDTLERTELTPAA